MRDVLPQDVYHVREIVARLCRLQDEVATEIHHCDYAADCICGEGGFWPLESAGDYRNDEKALEFIERAVRDAIAQVAKSREASTTTSPPGSDRKEA